MTKLFNQKMEISAFFSILWILSLMVRYFTGIPTFITSASNAKVVLSRIYSFIQRGLVSNDAEVSDLKVLNISLRNVSYSVEKRNIFKNLNIDIPLNGIIYVKGGPGSGKSLLLNILMGNIVPDSGEILLHLSDGSKVAVRASSENIMRKATFLADSPFLFRGTVKQNVLVDFDNSLRDEKVSYILKAVELEDELSEDFLIAEGGKNLSGGQKQRIVLARAILKKSEFFIFDNPFSALDEITIEKICSQFKKLDKPIILTSTRKDFSRYSQVINLDELINE